MNGMAGVLTPFGREQYSAAERDVSEDVRQFPSARVKKLGAMLRRNIGTINWILLSSTADGSGTLIYHIAQKTMPRPVSPFFSLTVAFSIATIVCLLVLLSTTPAPFRLWHDVSWSSIVLGFAVVSIESGYLIAYRLGWKLNRTSLFSNVSVAILLVPLGTFLFRERVSLRMVLGPSLCIIGLILLVQ
jgi:drug/metabolite transporter (DMT)-like permease